MILVVVDVLKWGEQLSYLQLHFKLLCLIVITFTVVSCSHYSLENSTYVKVDRKKRKVEVSVQFKDKGMEIDIEEIRQPFIAGLNTGINGAEQDKTSGFVYQIVENNQVCKVLLKYDDDRFKSSSWKPWVSGLSLGIIPIKYKINYEATVTNGKRKEVLEYNSSAWRSIFFIPGFFALTSQEEISSRVGNDVSATVEKICGAEA